MVPIETPGGAACVRRTQATSHGFVVAIGPETRSLTEGGAHSHGPSSAPWRHIALPGATGYVLAQPSVTTPEAVREIQPIEVGDLVLVYEGRVENRAEIADRLGRPPLGRSSDGVVLAEGFCAWGADVAAHAIGEFACVCLNRATGAVAGFRDPLGIRHLYVARRGATTWLASNLVLLLAQWPSRPPVDADSLAEYFVEPGNLLSGRTLFAGVDELKAGHVVESKAAEPFRSRRYWTPRPHDLPICNDLEYEEQLRALLFDAVGPALRASGAVVCELSGGLDSSTVASMAALSRKRSNGSPDDASPLLAYSLVFDETYRSDEGACEEAVASKHEIERFAIDHERCRPFDVSGAAGAAMPTHLLAYAGLQRRLRALARARGIRVCLTGVGGDQLFGSHGTLPPLMLADPLRRGLLLRWYRETCGWAQQGPYSLSTLVTTFSRGRLPKQVQELSLPSWLTPRFRATIQTQYEALLVPPEPLLDNPARDCQFHKITQMAHAYRPKAVGWEERHPLFSRPLVEFMLAVPWRLIVAPGHNRILQRRALRGILPDLVRLRTATISFGPLMLRGFDEHWPALLPLMSVSHLAAMGLVEPAAFRESCRRARLGMPDSRNIGLYRAAFTLEAWLRGRSSDAPGSGV